ncbi:MAG: SMP-30/gluconolactonase/LRE family protein [Robiginitomaculum sp.]|nr:SMP-30/gluconolactonase/LRE family protein [Robiginitomaculum sp.]
MNKTLGRGALIFVIILVIGSFFWWRTMLWTGQLRGVQAHFDGSCEVVTGIVGAEDLVIDRENRLVYISSSDRRNLKSGGSLWQMPVDNPAAATMLKLPDMGTSLFAPHGLDLFIDNEGVRHLFVIDHGSRPKELIHKFIVQKNQLLLQETFSDPEFYSPNDIAAIGPEQFYITNDSRTKTGSIAATIEAVFRKKSGNVVWYDGQQATEVASGFSFANGVAVSKDGEQLFVSATIDQNLRIFDREPNTGVLNQIDQIHFSSGLDNIDIAADGSLWIGSHPRLLDFSAHAKDPSKLSPSQVFRVNIDKKTVKEVYLAADGLLNASSVAASIDDLLFIGGVFDEAILVCQQKKEEK